MILIHLILFFLSPISPAQTQDGWEIPPLEEFALDGKDTEWSDIPAYYYRFDQSTNIQAAGAIGENDLQISFKTGWSEKGLHFFFDWQDDISDEHRIGLDSARVEHNGRSMDRMYFYDNLKIVASVDGQRVVAWFAPREDAVQWYSYRAPDGQGQRSGHMPAPAYRLTPHEDGFYLETQLDWETFKLKPEEVKALQLTIILVDSDLPDMSITDKLNARQVSYVSKSGEAELIK